MRKVQTCTPQCKGRYINDQPDRTIQQFVPIRLSFSFGHLSSSAQYWLVKIWIFVESFFSCSKSCKNKMKLFVSWIAFLRLRVAFFIKNLKNPLLISKLLTESLDRQLNALHEFSFNWGKIHFSPFISNPDQTPSSSRQSNWFNNNMLFFIFGLKKKWIFFFKWFHVQTLRGAPVWCLTSLM